MEEAGEVEPLVKREPLKATALATAAFACLSGLLLGYDIGVSNGVLLPITHHFDLSNTQMELFVGCLNYMALPGCFAGGYFAEWFGRRGSIAIGAVSFLVGNLLMTYAQRFKVLVVGRAFVGFAVGMTLVTEPLYVAETSPARLRGMLSTNVEISFNVGILLGFAASWGFGSLPDDTSWRWMLGVSLVAPVVSLLGLVFVLPESPRWLAANGRHDEAEAVLHWLLGPTEAARTRDLLRQRSEAPQEADEVTWWQFFTCRETRWLITLGGGIAFFSQATGIESIMYYSAVILERAGYTRNQMLSAMVFIGLVKLLAIVAQGSVVDRVGRRPLLVISSLGMSASMMTLGAAFGLSWAEWTKLVPLFTFIVLFSIGFGPIVYTLNAELYPNRSRAKGLTVAMFVGRCVSSIVSTGFLTLAGMLTYCGAFVFFGGWGLLAAVFVVVLLPETAGKPLESGIDEYGAKQA